MRREARQPVLIKPYLYIVMLALSLVLALLGQFVLNDEIQQSTHNVHTLDLVNQQRLLSQKVSRSAVTIETTALSINSQTRQHYQELLSTTLARWQQLHDNNTVARTDGETISLYRTLEPHYRSLLNASYTLLASITLQASRSMIDTAVRSILHEEPTYVHLLDALIIRYQRTLTQRVLYLKSMDIIAFSGVAIVILESVLLLVGTNLSRPCGNVITRRMR